MVNLLKSYHFKGNFMRLSLYPYSVINREIYQQQKISEQRFRDNPNVKNESIFDLNLKLSLKLYILLNIHMNLNEFEFVMILSRCKSRNIGSGITQMADFFSLINNSLFNKFKLYFIFFSKCIHYVAIYQIFFKRSL